MPKISVIIPTFNRKAFLCNAINSVLAQTFKDFEIIIVDDGSTDDTNQAVEDYIAKYPEKLKYYYQSNMGEGAARNKGIDSARGEYIAFLDSDDEWMPQKLEYQNEILDKNRDIGLTYSQAKRVDENGKTIDIKPTIPAMKPNDFLRGGKIPMTVLLRRSCINAIGAFDEGIKVGVDTDMWLRFSLKYEINFLKLPLAIIKQHKNNISNNEIDWYLGHIKILNKLLTNKINHNFKKKFLRSMLAKQLYFISRGYHRKKLFFLSLQYCCSSLKKDILLGKTFIEKRDKILTKIIKLLKPYCFLLKNLMLIPIL